MVLLLELALISPALGGEFPTPSCLEGGGCWFCCSGGAFRELLGAKTPMGGGAVPLLGASQGILCFPPSCPGGIQTD